jgi:hypothetical protein
VRRARATAGTLTGEEGRAWISVAWAREPQRPPGRAAATGRRERAGWGLLGFTGHPLEELLFRCQYVLESSNQLKADRLHPMHLHHLFELVLVLLTGQLRINHFKDWSWAGFSFLSQAFSEI